VLESLLDARWSLPVLLDLDHATPEYVLVESVVSEGAPGAVAPTRYAPITPELCFLLAAADPHASRAELEATARELGAEPGEEGEIVDAQIVDGLLIATG
jgi:hypothetical protein